MITLGELKTQLNQDIDEIKNNKTSYPYVSGMLVQVTRNITNVILNHEKN